jgi:hypothetical protein
VLNADSMHSAVECVKSYRNFKIIDSVECKALRHQFRFKGAVDVLFSLFQELRFASARVA